MKVIIAGGGTGGHVIPALAIAQEWMSRGKEREVVLVGTERGIEMKLVPQAGLPLETLRARPGRKWTLYPKDVLPAWMATPFIVQPIRRASGVSSSGVTIQGPTGQKPAIDLPSSHWSPSSHGSRELMSLIHV